jgi:hypothetical protein
MIIIKKEEEEKLAVGISVDIEYIYIRVGEKERVNFTGQQVYNKQ